MDDTDNKLREYIDMAGGPSVLSRELNISRKAIWRWQKKGLPNTEWSGLTHYAEAIAKLCRQNGNKVFKQMILGQGR